MRRLPRDDQLAAVRAEPLEPTAAAAELRANAGTQFDEDVVLALLRVVERH